MSAGALAMPAGDAKPPARIGPNAIWRVAEVLDEAGDPSPAARVFGAAGLAHYLHAMPGTMVDERHVTALHRALRSELGVTVARRVGHEGGVRTADYLLAQRVPKAFQALLRRLPAGLAARLLLVAIARHAWTFAGSGRFAWRGAGRAAIEFEIAGCPLCRGVAATEAPSHCSARDSGIHSAEPLCDYYAGTFERLCRVLAHDRARVTQLACSASGARACRFLIRL